MDVTHGLRYSMHDRVCILARLSTFIGAKWTPGRKGKAKRQAEPNAVEALVFKWLHNHTPQKMLHYLGTASGNDSPRTTTALRILGTAYVDHFRISAGAITGPRYIYRGVVGAVENEDQLFLK